MPMRSDCRHFFRRTTRDGERLDGCAMEAAPDAPLSCPANCSFFEKRTLSHTGFVYGSLSPGAAEKDDPPLDADAQDLLEELKDFIDDVGTDVEAAEKARRAAEQKQRDRRKRKKLF